MSASLELNVGNTEWRDAAVGYNNLTGLHLVLGHVQAAITAAQRSVESADKSPDDLWRVASRTTLADALHQSGDEAEATGLFEDAERMQAELQPGYPILHALQGYRYCDLLLDQDRASEVRDRATRMQDWAEARDSSRLTVALGTLTLGRAHPGGSDEAAANLDKAVSGLRRAGALDMLPLGLLARAEHFRYAKQWTKAQHDLDEVREIATRCEMRLHLTDYHLEQARLLLAQGGSKEDARGHYEKAKNLIDATGYHRRDGELAELGAQL